MTTINFPHEFKDIVRLYNERKFNEALRLLDSIPNNKKFENLKLKLYASIYFINKDWIKSLKYHKDLLLKNEVSYEIYNIIILVASIHIIEVLNLTTPRFPFKFCCS